MPCHRHFLSICYCNYLIKKCYKTTMLVMHNLLNICFTVSCKLSSGVLFWRSSFSWRSSFGGAERTRPAAMWRSRASIAADAKKSKMTKTMLKKLKMSKFKIKYVFFVSIDAKKSKMTTTISKKLKMSIFEKKCFYFLYRWGYKKSSDQLLKYLFFVSCENLS
jgi:hypothetical protein